MLLVLAANTVFADFPRLSSFLARDGFLPRIFQFRGERLAFNSGIIVLAVVAAVLIVAFGGSVAALIPLYTVGVFIAFTLSQSGMVRRWYRLRDDGAGLAPQGADQRRRRADDGDRRDRGRRDQVRLRRLGRAGPHPDPHRDDAVHQAPVHLDGRAARGRARTSSCPARIARSA